MEDENDENDENDNFGNDFDAYDRATKGNIAQIATSYFTIKNPESSTEFAGIIDAVFTTLINDNIFTFIRPVDRDTIIEATEDIKMPGYKNALCLIIGFYASNAGNNISAEKLNIILKELPNLDRISSIYSIFRIKPQDVLRYARFWLNLVKLY